MRKISNFQTIGSFVAQVVLGANQAKTKEFREKTQTFTAGYEYTAQNFYKGSSRPPKMRILNIFRPLVGSLPNATNDTYVIYQNYDYALGRFRGPYCGADGGINGVKSSTPLDFYVSTIDNFGKNFGDLYSGVDGSVSTTFTPPSISYVTQTSNLNFANTGTLGVRINAGHKSGTFRLQGGSNVEFHGFLTVSGYSGAWAFYSINSGGVNKTFDVRSGVRPLYKSGTWPYVQPTSGKSVNEWRYMPLCSKQVSSLYYFPLKNVNGTLGSNEIRNAGGSPPAGSEAFPVLPAINIYTEMDITGWNDQMLLSQPSGITLYNDDQGLVLSPSGYYMSQNYYAYYSSETGGFSGITQFGGGGGPTFNGAEFEFIGPFPSAEDACSLNGRAQSNIGVIDTDLYGEPGAGAIVYSDMTGTSPISWMAPYMWYNVIGKSVMIDDSGNIVDESRCR